LLSGSSYNCSLTLEYGEVFLNIRAFDFSAKVLATRHVMPMTIKTVRKLRSAISVFSMFGIKSDPKIEYGVI